MISLPVFGEAMLLMFMFIPIIELPVTDSSDLLISPLG